MGAKSLTDKKQYVDTLTDIVENLSKKKIQTLINDPVKTAAAVNLFMYRIAARA